MNRIRAVIFDLDNVLYNERTYLLAAYRNIAEFLSKRYQIGKRRIYLKLARDSREKSSMYPRLFNDLLSDLEINQEILPELLEIFTNTKVNLKLRAAVEKVLLNLGAQGIKLCLLTNGTFKTQMNKVKLLGIEKYFPAIVYARNLGKENEKPNPNAYLAVLKELNMDPKHTICIGDNPYTDFSGAKKIGIMTVRLLCGEFKHVKLTQQYEADRNVRTLSEFYRLIEKLNKEHHKDI